MTEARRAPALQARWNKDLTITLRANHKKVHHTRVNSSISALDEIASFARGWFGEEWIDQNNVLRHPRINWTIG